MYKVCRSSPVSLRGIAFWGKKLSITVELCTWPIPFLLLLFFTELHYWRLQHFNCSICVASTALIWLNNQLPLFESYCTEYLHEILVSRYNIIFSALLSRSGRRGVTFRLRDCTCHLISIEFDWRCLQVQTPKGIGIFFLPNRSTFISATFLYFHTRYILVEYTEISREKVCKLCQQTT